MKKTYGDVKIFGIDNIEALSLNYQMKLDDIYATSLLQPLLNNFPFLPFTRGSLRPFCLSQILNDIIINSRKNIIEFGSGVSTILIGRLIKKNNLNTTILSIENNEAWIEQLTNILRAEQIDDIVDVQFAPLERCTLAYDDNNWYDLKVLGNLTKDKNFDMVIVDGPEAWELGKGMARYPALPFIADKLEKRFSIYLDDAIREGEKKVIEIWEKEFGINFRIKSKSLAYYHQK